MSQYDRHGAGMNCSGRNQYEITEDGIEGLRKQLSKQNTSSIESKPKHYETNQLDDLGALFKDGNPTKEDESNLFAC